MHVIRCALACACAALVVSLLSIGGSAHPGVAGVTWTGSASRVLARRCATCHDAEGGIQPSLNNYEDARRAAQSIKHAVLTHRMPRWDAVPGFGDFRNEHRLTPYEADLLAEWADSGTPYGDGAATPHALHAVHVEAPNLVVRVPSKHRIQETSYTFELKVALETDRWIRGWDFQPGNPSMIKAAVIALPSGETLGTWVPGDSVTFLPEGVAYRLAANSTIVLTIYYREPEAPAVDSSGVALYFSSRPEREMKLLALPCGVTRLPESIDALAIRPAVGASGRTMTVLARRSDRQMEPLGWFRDYSDDSPQTYWFSQPPELPAGTSIQVTAAHGRCGAELDYVSVTQHRALGRAVLPTSLQADDDAASGYQCPMHPEVRSDSPGTCVRCRMTLVPSRGQIEGKYALEAALVKDTKADPERPALRLVVREPGSNAIIRRFETVHERPFHLFVLSDDMTEFAHIHPESRPDGSLEVTAPRMQSSAYHLFADFLPVGGTPQILRSTVITSADAPRMPDLVPDYSEKTGRRLRVRLDTRIGEFTAGTPTLLTFVLTDPITGAPVTDIEPYLGAWGHMFIVSADLEDAVHSHPIAPLASEGGPTEGGPTVVFRQRFPRAGLYRLWTQFQRGGEVETVSFTVAVN